MNKTVTQPQQTLIAILEEKLVWAKTILALTKEHEQALNNEEVEPYQQKLDERQEAIDHIQRLDALAAEAAATLKPELPRPEDADKGTLKNVERVGLVNGEIKKLFGEILEEEKKNADLAEKKLGVIRNDLRAVRQGIRNENAYRPAPVIGDGIYFDKKK